jgi:hypothetical protein
MTNKKLNNKSIHLFFRANAFKIIGSTPIDLKISIVFMSSSRTGFSFCLDAERNKEIKKKRCSPALGHRAPRRFFGPPLMVSASCCSSMIFLSQKPGGLFIIDFLNDIFSIKSCQCRYTIPCISIVAKEPLFVILQQINGLILSHCSG